MMKRNAHKGMFGLSMAAGVGIVLLAGYLNAQGQNGESQEAGAQATALKVGTYNLQTVFEQNPAQEKLMQMADSIQAEMQAAQEEGSMENMQQMQQQFEMQRTQVINQFQDDVAQVVPELAQDAGVQVIALEIRYTADNVEVKDLTSQLVETLNEQSQDGAESEQEEEEGALLQFLQ